MAYTRYEYSCLIARGKWQGRGNIVPVSTPERVTGVLDAVSIKQLKFLAKKKIKDTRGYDLVYLADLQILKEV